MNLDVDELRDKVYEVELKIEQLREDVPGIVWNAFKSICKKYAGRVRSILLWSMPIISWLLGMVALVRYLR